MDINKMKKRHLLQVFELITRKGVKTEGVYEYHDIKASQDFDGYTCWLSFKDLTVTLLFHGAYDLDYKSEETLKIFFKKIANLLDD
ncbi:DUF3081 domain-containing protein [Psychromonas sp. B3M02]|uniref:DUF3081 family protein n=2 Tax=unclassified Psychromonas TaxID=2614957 RepID=UPI000DE8B143|nr:DUF3081 family protein [Psychromonas sp. B3M02]RBW41619.1 DUF3081 domain-containing protein [Psychromonas sp. B3M02]